MWRPPFSAQVPGAATGGAVAPQVLTTTTSSGGLFNFEKLPPEPVVFINVDGYAPQVITITQSLSLDVKLVPNVIRGRVLGTDGKPVPGASVWAATAMTTSGPDGGYRLKDVPPKSKLVVKAPGYLATSLEVGQVLTQDVSIQPFTARAIYVNADSVATPGKLQQLLALVESTELSAVVIDVKADNSGKVLYNSKLPEIQQMGVANQLIPDLDGLLANLKQRKIYTIARMSVFWDQAAVAARPEWALKSKKAPGQTWVDRYGNRWTNPYMKEVQDYNIAIATEVAQRGFDEVQFDNAHFPSDGDLEDIDFGASQAGRKRVDAIVEFLERAWKALSPLGAYSGYNVFGLTPYVQDDMGIGQHFEEIVAHVDYVCPAIYPSNFGDGFMNFPKPAEHPAEIVSQTLKNAIARSSSAHVKVRPWLQDFSTAVKYEAPQVRAEIDAAEQNGALGWMLWNFNNTYTEAALKRQ
jgi:hypothetical protein